MSYLVTGGLGFIGKHLVEYLLKTDKESNVFVYDNLYRSKLHSFNSNSRVKVIIGDIRNFDAMKKVLPERINSIFHLAAQSNVLGSEENAEFSISTNIEGTSNLLKLAKECFADNFIFTSSREVYGQQETFPVSEDAKLNPKNLYGRTKMTAENYCDIYKYHNSLSGINVFRLGNVYGIGDKGRVIPDWIRKAKNNEPLIIYGENKYLDFVHVSQVVKMLTIPLKEKIDYKINVANGIPTRLEDLAELIIKKTGSKSEILKKEERNIEVTQYVADTTKMKHYLGKDFEENSLFGLEEIINDEN